MQRSTTSFFLFLFHRQTIKVTSVFPGTAVYGLLFLPSFL
jgi:hypothetical protein